VLYHEVNGRLISCVERSNTYTDFATTEQSLSAIYNPRNRVFKATTNFTRTQRDFALDDPVSSIIITRSTKVDNIGDLSTTEKTFGLLKHTSAIGLMQKMKSFSPFSQNQASSGSSNRHRRKWSLLICPRANV
jgi:hypothetical protein